MKPIPLFSSSLKSISPSITAQRRLNCFWDIRVDGDKSSAVLIGTPGAVLWVTLPAAPVRGFWVVGALLYVVSGSVLFKVSAAGTITQLGVLSTNAGKVGMADNGIEIIIVDGAFGYILTLASSAFAKIVDGNFPNGASSVAFINGRFVVEKAGTRQAYISNSYAGATWTPVTFITKENASDTLLAVEAFDGLLILWGESTIEFWQDVGAAPIPYVRVQGATQVYGLAAAKSIVSIGSRTVFLGVSAEGAVQVLRLNGYNPEPISTTDVDALISTFGVISDAVALGHTVYGHAMYQITFPTAGRSLFYDVKTDLWYEAQTGLALTARHLAELGTSFEVGAASNVISDSTTGNLYYLDPNTYTDNGVAIKRQIDSRHVNSGGDVLTVSELQLDMETGVGLLSGQGSDPQISVETSKDNGFTFGTPKLTSMGKAGQRRSPRAVWRRFGKAHDFVFRFTVTDPVKFVVVRGQAVVS